MLEMFDSEDVNENELLNKVALWVGDDVDMLDVIVEYCDCSVVGGALQVLKRDLSFINNIILKKLYDEGV